jgi:Tfp pilus assembly protein PilN
MEERTKQIFMYALAAVIVIFGFLICALLYFFKIPEGNENALMLAIGQFLTFVGFVVGYYFGSSKTSADKSEAMSKTADKLAEKVVAQPPVQL